MANTRNGKYRSRLKNAGKEFSKTVLKQYMPSLDNTIVDNHFAMKNYMDSTRRSRATLKFGVKRIKSTLFSTSAEIIDRLKNQLDGNDDGGLDVFTSMFDDDTSSSSNNMNSALGNSEYIKAMASSNMGAMTSAAEYTADVMINSNTQSMVLQTKHHMEMMKGLKNIENIGMSIVDFNNNNILSAIEAANRYYDESLSELREINESLKTMSSKYNTSSSAKTTSYDKIMGGGGINFKAYKDIVKGNIKNKIPLDFSTFFTTVKDDPLGAALNLVSGMVMPKKSGAKLQKLDNTLTGLFSSFLLKMNDLKTSDKSYNRFLGNILGLQDYHAYNRINLKAYSNMDYATMERQRNKAVIEVIPTYLNEIVKSINGKDMFYNYSTGKFQNKAAAKKEQEENIKEHKLSGMESTKSSFNTKLNSISNVVSKNKMSEIEADLDTFLIFLIENGIAFDPTKHTYQKLKSLGLSLLGGEKNFKIIVESYKKMSISERSVMRNEQVRSNYMFKDTMYNLSNEIQESGESILFNGYDSEPSKKGGKPKYNKSRKRRSKSSSTKSSTSSSSTESYDLDEILSAIKNSDTTDDDYESKREKKYSDSKFGRAHKKFDTAAGKFDEYTSKMIDDIANSFDTDGKNYRSDDIFGIVGSMVQGFGGGLSTILNSTKKMLIGEYDEESGEFKGGKLPKSVADAMIKYLPSSLKGAAKGATIGAMTKHPILGGAIGAGFGMLKANEDIQNFLWGSKDGKEKGLLSGLKEKFNEKIKDPIKKKIREKISPTVDKFFNSGINFLRDKTGLHPDLRNGDKLRRTKDFIFELFGIKESVPHMNFQAHAHSNTSSSNKKSKSSVNKSTNKAKSDNTANANINTEVPNVDTDSRDGKSKDSPLVDKAKSVFGNAFSKYGKTARNAAISSMLGLGPMPGILFSMVFDKDKKKKKSSTTTIKKEDKEQIIEIDKLTSGQQNQEQATQSLFEKMGFKNVGKLKGAGIGALAASMLGFNPILGATVGLMFAKKKPKKSNGDTNQQNPTEQENIDENTQAEEKTEPGFFRSTANKIIGGAKGIGQLIGNFGKNLFNSAKNKGTEIKDRLAKKKANKEAATTSKDIRGDIDTLQKGDRDSYINDVENDMNSVDTPEEMAATASRTSIVANLFNAGGGGVGDGEKKSGVKYTSWMDALFGGGEGDGGGGGLIGAIAGLVGGGLIKKLGGTVLNKLGFGKKAADAANAANAAEAVENAANTADTLKNVSSGAKVAGAYGSLASGAAATQLVKTGVDVYKEAKSGGDVGSAAVEGVGKAANFAVKAVGSFGVMNGLAKNPAIGGKITQAITKVTTGLIGKLTKKFGKSIIGRLGAKIVNSLAGKLCKAILEAPAKLMNSIAQKLGLGAATGGLTILATATADAIYGWNTANEILGIPSEIKATVPMCLSCALGNALSNLTLGIIPVKTLAQLIYKLFGKIDGEDAQENLENLQSQQKAGYADFVNRTGSQLSEEQYNKASDKKWWQFWRKGLDKYEDEAAEKNGGTTYIDNTTTNNVVMTQQENGGRGFSSYTGRGIGETVLDNLKGQELFSDMFKGTHTRVMSAVQEKGDSKGVIKKLGTKLSSLASGAWEKLKNSGIGKLVGRLFQNTKANIGKGINGLKDFGKNIWNKITGGNESGGRGGDDPDYYNQNDPRWSSMPFGMYNGHTDTVGDGGCGPTVMATVLQKLTGAEVTPDELANIALKGGYKADDGGTDTSFFNDVGSAVGINFDTENGIGQNSIANLVDGVPTIFMGKDNGGGKSPFGNNMHYVIGTGIDRNGNVSVLDPKNRNNNKRKFNIRNIASSTLRSIAPGAGRGTGYKNAFKTFGRGNVTWSECVKECKKAMNATYPDYSMSVHREVTVYDKTVYTRFDCSGFVSLCLNIFGEDIKMQNTHTLPEQKYQYFDVIKGTNLELQPYDIVIVHNSANQHAQIFVENSGGYHRGYNWGGTDSAQNPGMTTMNKYTYTAIIRPKNGAGTASTLSASGNTNNSSSSGSSTKFKAGGKILDWQSNLDTAMNESVPKYFGKLDDAYTKAFSSEKSGDGSSSGSDGSGSNSSSNSSNQSNSSNSTSNSSSTTNMSSSAADRDITQWDKNTVTSELLHTALVNAGVADTSAFSGHEQLFIDAGNKYGIDPRALLAITCAENSYGTNMRYSNNAGSIRIDGKFKGFNTLNEGIDYMARMLADYPGESNKVAFYTTVGNTSFSKIQPRYCPDNEGGSNWLKNTTAAYQQMLDISGGRGNNPALHGVPKQLLAKVKNATSSIKPYQLTKTAGRGTTPNVPLKTINSLLSEKHSNNVANEIKTIGTEYVRQQSSNSSATETAILKVLNVIADTLSRIEVYNSKMAEQDHNNYVVTPNGSNINLNNGTVSNKNAMIQSIITGI